MGSFFFHLRQRLLITVGIQRSRSTQQRILVAPEASERGQDVVT
jgi:hypothetical protein